MTGRELIIYILENGLEDEPIITDGKIVGFISVYEAAAKLNVGVASIKLLMQQGKLKYIQIGGEYFVYANNVYFKEKQLKGE